MFLALHGRCQTGCDLMSFPSGVIVHRFSPTVVREAAVSLMNSQKQIRFCLLVVSSMFGAIFFVQTGSTKPLFGWSERGRHLPFMVALEPLWVSSRRPAPISAHSQGQRTCSDVLRLYSRFDSCLRSVFRLEIWRLRENTAMI